MSEDIKFLNDLASYFEEKGDYYSADHLRKIAQQLQIDFDEEYFNSIEMTKVVENA